MTKKPTKSTQTSAQIDKFREAARELDTDQSEEAFDRALKAIAKSGSVSRDAEQNPQKRVKGSGHA
nr:hypothetical protein RAR13_00070 [Aminobacter aminovorans]